VNTTATLDQMASGDTRTAPVRKAKWHLGEHLNIALVVIVVVVLVGLNLVILIQQSKTN